MERQEIIRRIKERMSEIGTDYVHFIYDRSKPFIQHEGIRYEIVSISDPDEEDETIHISVIPSYSFCIKDFYLDSTWKISSWRKIWNLVDSKVERLNEELQ